MIVKTKNKVLAMILSMVIIITVAMPVILNFNITASDSNNPLNNLVNFATRYIVARNKVFGGSHYAYTEAVSDDRNTSFDGEERNFRSRSELVLVTIARNAGDTGITTSSTTLFTLQDSVVRDPDVSPDGKTLVFSMKRGNSTNMTSTVLLPSPNANFDDYNIYTMDITGDSPASWRNTIKQITFGSGHADIEPKWLPNGKIVFNSTRASQTVDCWKVPVSNLYYCDADGKNVTRIGFDQVHTTYPTVTEDGRILTTRWDYNDRNQMYVQGVLQMMPDGTGQTEVFGLNNNFPTTLLHTRDIPGAPGKYVSIASGHHNDQGGKLVILDTNVDRNAREAVKFIQPGNYYNTMDNIDAQNQQGNRIYRYPYAINENEILVSRFTGGSVNESNHGHRGYGENSAFVVGHLNAATGEFTQLLASSGSGANTMPASQLTPIRERNLHERPTPVDYGSKTGTMYVGNVYDGDGLLGVPEGVAKYLRVVEIEYRPYAIGANAASSNEPAQMPGKNVTGLTRGTSDPYTPVSTANGAWDVKKVLGIIDIEEDGSALFKVPAETPIYLQVLNEEGEMIQSMRSWATLMPNETFSCVGCHEDKNTAPPANMGVTMAMQKQPQNLKKDLWMTDSKYNNYTYEDAKGFSYNEMVQPILDKSCISCHDNTSQAEEKVGISSANTGNKTVLHNITQRNATARYFTGSNENSAPANWMNEDFNDSSWNTGAGPFGQEGTPPGGRNTNWSGTGSQLFIFTRQTFNMSSQDIERLQNREANLNLNIAYDESPIIYINGQEITRRSSYITNYTNIIITAAALPHLKEGTNTLAIRADNNGGGGSFIGQNLELIAPPPGTAEPFSLRGTPIESRRERMYYPLSYLVLTNSTRRGDQYWGNPAPVGEGYANWISGMSQCEMLDPYQYGSTQSRMIQHLKNNNSHKDILSFEDRYIISQWMDLGVPSRGSYNELSAWNDRETGESLEKDNVRAYHNMVDMMSKRNRANNDTHPVIGNSGNIKIEWVNTQNNSIVSQKEGIGLVQLTLGNTGHNAGGAPVTPASQRLTTANRRIRVTLPDDQKHFYFNLDSRVKEALIYAPDGVFEYTVPSSADLQNTMPFTLREHNFPTISARLPSYQELAAEKNIALNPYATATDDHNNAFPHATTNSAFPQTGNGNGDANYRARCAIDGFVNNKFHGEYPAQSWGPAQNVNGLFYEINFGRSVKANRLELYIRADFPHDDPFNNVEVEFSDGTKQNLGGLQRTADAQKFNLNGKETSSVKLYCTASSNTWAGFTQVEVYGMDINLTKPLEILKNDLNDAINNIEKEMAKLNKKDYSADSWAALENIVENAKTVNENNKAEESQLIDTTGSLENALDVLQPRTDLELAIDALNDEIEKAKTLKESDYSEETWANLQEALKEMEKFAKNPGTDITQIKGVTSDLSEAIEELESHPSLIKAALDELETEITGIENLKLVDSDWSHTTWAVYITAMTEAKQLLENPGKDILLINEARENLTDAVENLSEKSSLEAAADALEAEYEKTQSEFENLNSDDYSPESWLRLETAINAAKDILDNGGKEAEINTAIQNLTIAISTLVNITELSAKIAEAEAILENAEEGIEVGQYPQGSKEILQTQINAAKAIFGKTDATQIEVNTAAVNLNTAAEEFAAKIIVITDKTALQAAITQAAAYNASDWSILSWGAVQTALTAANTINENTNATQAEINSAITVLEDALNVLTTDRTALQAAIAEAEDKTEADWTEESWSAMQTALTAAIAQNTETAKQSDINIATTTLTDAITALTAVEIPPTIDKTALQAAIANAGTKKAADYTAASWGAMQTALTAANTVNANTNATQAEVDTAATALTTAINSLTAVPIIPPVVRRTVTFNTAGGTKINPIQVNNNTTVAKPANPTRKGFRFIGWYTTNKFTKTFVFGAKGTRITRNTTIFACFERIATPKRLRKGKVTRTSIGLKWNASKANTRVKGAITYTVQMSTRKNKGFKTVYSGKKRSATIKKGIRRNRTYYFRIRANKKISKVTVRSAFSKVNKASTIKSKR